MYYKYVFEPKVTDMEEKKKIPVILDTDIGDDIDDTWALALLLRCPELDPRLVVTCQEIKNHL